MKWAEGGKWTSEFNLITLAMLLAPIFGEIIALF
jgi:hypothetical protein